MFAVPPGKPYSRWYFEPWGCGRSAAAAAWLAFIASRRRL